MPSELCNPLNSTAHRVFLISRLVIEGLAPYKRQKRVHGEYIVIKNTEVKHNLVFKIRRNWRKLFPT